MSKRILITGAGSGFGKQTALRLAKKGHTIHAGVFSSEQKEELQRDAEKQGVSLNILKLDITRAEDIELAAKLEIDVLLNNAGIMLAGPVAEIPSENVRQNFETNVFGTLAITQAFAPQMVKRGSGKIIFVSSMGGLITVPFCAIYTATKHAIESLAEGLKAELVGTGVEICTVNPGAFATGFNDRGAGTMEGWFDPAKSLTKPEVFEATLASLGNQFEPEPMYEAMTRVIEEDSSKFRNVVPAEIEPWIKAMHENAWSAKKDDPVWIDPTSL